VGPSIGKQRPHVHDTTLSERPANLRWIHRLPVCQWGVLSCFLVWRQAPMASFFFLVSILLAVGLGSWIRTAPIRRGEILQARDPPGRASDSSSAATFLAAIAGVAAAAWGAIAAGEGQRTVGVFLVAAGLFIAAAGSVARVAGLRAGAEGFVVLFARRPPFAASWIEIAALRPPRSPLGGWRVTNLRGDRWTLMPSDLLGHEALLDLIVVRASLRFDGRSWSRYPT